MVLKPIRHIFEDIEQADFCNLGKYFEPLMHVICLIWANSKFYNTAPRIIVLLQEICNMLIDLVSKTNTKFCYYH